MTSAREYWLGRIVEKRGVRHPSAEVIALQRCGNRDAMKVAGQEYLRRFPAGFRHAEVKGSLGDAGS
jgi:hypothetical protein